MLEIKNVFERYCANIGNFDINLKINYGECFGILGPNGAGKTKLIRQIASFIKSDYWIISLDGIDSLNNSRKNISEIGCVASEISLYKKLTGKQFLEMICLAFSIIVDNVEKDIC